MLLLQNRLKQIKAELENWLDYVFKKDYQLVMLKEVKGYIDQNDDLPDVPSEQQVQKDGLNLGEMNAKLLKKVEKLTLYLRGYPSDTAGNSDCR